MILRMDKLAIELPMWFQKQIDAGAATLKLSPFELPYLRRPGVRSGHIRLSVKPKTGQPISDTGKYIVVVKKEGADLEDFARRVQQRSSAAGGEIRLLV